MPGGTGRLRRCSTAMRSVRGSGEMKKACVDTICSASALPPKKAGPASSATGQAVEFSFHKQLSVINGSTRVVFVVLKWGGHICSHLATL
jgi:hypothetical protein